MIKVNNIDEVIKYYGKKYRKILNAFKEKKVSYFLIDEKCGSYLELTAKMENGNTIFVNHGISNSKPYNVFVSPAETWFGKTERYHCSNMASAYEKIIEEKYK